MERKESHGERFEDLGLGRIIKYWPLLLLIFTVGGWYRESQTNAVLVDKHEKALHDDEQRITQVEDAVKYLAQIVKHDRLEGN